MPEIFVYLFEGRSLDQKRELVRALTAGAASSLDVPPHTVTVQLLENPRTMRSRGGVLFCDMPPPDASAPAVPPSSPTS